ncbi:uncharacterized protein LOC123705811 [Colias croceus]|uniref:uncharacterized protein LOC123705811 n=1 Tax=Colias crocea TaxID=72248 RepID=UPI001E281218|nr:uncharacterized protein LOC123705811 [Colias croceus]
MQFEYEPETLIEAVKKRPGIWDFENREYRSKVARHTLWLEVVREVAGNDINVTKSEMRELELQLQKKWKSIRDCFQKYISNPNRTKKPYVYCRLLEFLLKNQSLPSRDTGGGSDSEEDPAIKKVWRPIKKLKLTKMSSDEENDNYMDDTQSNDGIELEVTPSKPTINEFAFANVSDIANKSESEDPDKMFLLSLLPHLKAVPEEFRLNVKVDMMQVLRNASYHMVNDHKIM